MIGRAGVGHRQRRRRRCDAARDRRRERPRVDGRLRGGADDRADPRPRAQHPAGARGAEGRPLGALPLERGGGGRKDTGGDRFRTDRPAGRAPRARARHDGRSRTTPSSGPSASVISASNRQRRVDELLGASDVVTLHSPLTDETHCLIDRRRDRPDARRRAARQRRARRARRRGGARRGASLRQARRAPRSTSSRPSRTTARCSELDQVVVTPHLAASTDEAQDRAGVIVAEQIVAALDGGIVTNAVNIPVVDQADLEVLRPFIPLAALLGRISVKLAVGRPRRITVAAHGPLSEYDTRLLTAAALNGTFQERVDQVVNVVNAPLIAAERGIEVVEERNRASRDYTNTVEVRVVSDGEETTVSGTTIGPGAAAVPRRRARLRDRHRDRAAHGVHPLRRPARRDRDRRLDVRRRRRQHREHGGVADEGGRSGADGLLDRHARDRGARARVARRWASTTFASSGSGDRSRRGAGPSPSSGSRRSSATSGPRPGSRSCRRRRRPPRRPPTPSAARCRRS